MKHGHSAYNLGCRCDICRDVRRAYMRAYFQRPEVKEKKRAYFQEIRRLIALGRSVDAA